MMNRDGILCQHHEVGAVGDREAEVEKLVYVVASDHEEVNRLLGLEESPGLRTRGREGSQATASRRPIM